LGVIYKDNNFSPLLNLLVILLPLLKAPDPRQLCTANHLTPRNAATSVNLVAKSFRSSVNAETCVVS